MADQPRSRSRDAIDYLNRALPPTPPEALTFTPKPRSRPASQHRLDSPGHGRSASLPPCKPPSPGQDELGTSSRDDLTAMLDSQSAPRIDPPQPTLGPTLISPLSPPPATALPPRVYVDSAPSSAESLQCPARAEDSAGSVTTVPELVITRPSVSSGLASGSTGSLGHHEAAIAEKEQEGRPQHRRRGLIGPGGIISQNSTCPPVPTKNGQTMRGAPSSPASPHTPQRFASSASRYETHAPRTPGSDTPTTARRTPDGLARSPRFANTAESIRFRTPGELDVVEIPRFRKRELNLGMVRGAGGGERATWICLWILWVGNALASLFFDVNVIFMTIQCAKHPSYSTNSRPAWTFATAAYAVCWAVSVSVVWLGWEVAYEFWRRWSQPRPAIEPIYMSLPATTHLSLLSFPHFAFLLHIRLSPLSTPHALDVLPETAYALLQLVPGLVALLPRAAIAVVLLIAYWSPEAVVQTTFGATDQTAERDAAFFRPDAVGELTIYAKGVLLAFVVYVGARLLAVLTAAAVLLAFSQTRQERARARTRAARRALDARRTRSDASLPRDPSATASPAKGWRDEAELGWAWRERARARIQDAFELCMIRGWSASAGPGAAVSPTAAGRGPGGILLSPSTHADRQSVELLRDTVADHDKTLPHRPALPLGLVPASTAYPPPTAPGPPPTVSLPPPPTVPLPFARAAMPESSLIPSHPSFLTRLAFPAPPVPPPPELGGHNLGDVTYERGARRVPTQTSSAETDVFFTPSTSLDPLASAAQSPPATRAAAYRSRVDEGMIDTEVVGRLSADSDADDRTALLPASLYAQEQTDPASDRACKGGSMSGTASAGSASLSSLRTAARSAASSLSGRRTTAATVAPAAAASTPNLVVRARSTSLGLVKGPLVRRARSGTVGDGAGAGVHAYARLEGAQRQAASVFRQRSNLGPAAEARSVSG
ncbi:hypothetical protein Q5752_006394 [Cryptotrichosporon argae]